MKELILKVTVDEANQILEALGEMPFKLTFKLIGKIQQQAAEQLENSEETVPPENSDE